MKAKRKILLMAGLSMGLLACPNKSFALGGGGAGANVGSYTVNLTDLGPMSGKWSVSGGIDGFGSYMNNPSPTLTTRNQNTSYSIGEAVIQLHKADGWLHFTWWGGAWQTPTMGITSDYGAFNSVARLGSATNPLRHRPSNGGSRCSPRNTGAFRGRDGPRLKAPKSASTS